MSGAVALDDTAPSMPPLVPYQQPAQAGRKPARRIQPTLVAPAAAGPAAVAAQPLLVGSQGPFIPFAQPAAQGNGVHNGLHNSSGAHAALLATAPVRGAGSKRKRGVAAERNGSDFIGQLLGAEGSHHSAATVVLGEDGDDAPPALLPARPQRAASRMASSRLVASSTVPLLERRRSAQEDDEDADDDDWLDSDGEERKRPLRRKSKGKKPAASEPNDAVASPLSRKSSDASASTARTAGAPAAAAAAAPVAAPIPFIFNPAHLPSEAALAASDETVGRRFRTMLADTQPVGPTTARQRASMPKDLLLQRNLEIQAMQHSFDAQYEPLLRNKPAGWERLVSALDSAMDELAEESDEVETLLFEKFRVRGGGRMLISDDVLDAAREGQAIANTHVQQAQRHQLPLPTKLTLAPDATGAPAGASSSAAAAAASSSLTASLLPIREDEDVSDEKMSDEPSARGAASATAAIPSVPQVEEENLAAADPSSKQSRSDAAMWQRFDAEQARIRSAREQRRAKNTQGLLGQYVDFFKRFVDVDPSAPRRNSTPRKVKALQPASYPFYLGTMVLPLFSGEGALRPPTPVEEEEEEENEEDAEGQEEADVARAVALSLGEPIPAAAAPVQAAPAASAAMESDVVAAPAALDVSVPVAATEAVLPRIAEGQEAAGDADSDHEAGEEVWLDFERDWRFVDGCVVKQSRPIAGASDNNATEDVTLGVLPLEGLHPPAPEEPELELDDEGQPVPRRRRPRPMPDPTHPLAALYVLHETDSLTGRRVIRLESTLVRGRSTDASDPSECDRVEISISVISSIFHSLHLRSTAQKQALLTLFHLFAPPVNEEAQVMQPQEPMLESLYPSASGQLLPYTQLSEAEQRVLATTDFEAEPPAVVKQEPVPSLLPNMSDVAPMEMDDASPMPVVVPVLPPIHSDTPAAAPAALAPSSSVPFALGLNEPLDGDSIGDEEEDEDDEDDEDGEYSGEDSDASQADSADELFEEVLEKDRLVFVPLRLPGAEDEASDDEEEADEEAEEPNDVAENGADVAVKVEGEASAAAGGEADKTEAAELAALERGDSGPAQVTLDAEEKQLEAEQRVQWRPDSLHALFQSIRPTPAWTRRAAQPEGLSCTLRPFQQKALAWMMMRESEAAGREYDNPLWERVLLNGRPAFYNQFSGAVTREEPAKLKDGPCGILADEMGLGKTVDVCALVLKRPWVPPAVSAAASASMEDVRVKSEDGTENDHALALQLSGLPPGRPAPVPIGATLIVAPMSIVHQWAKEIARHAPGLRVFMYTGRKSDMLPEDAAKHVSESMAQFAAADIVLVTYAVMGQEVHYGQPLQHRLRREKRYAVPTSPLLDCHWHRVILDEAQQVHSSSSVPFRMAARLSCTSRFCVSGTPIGPSGLHDLYGLVSFLQVAPFEDPATSAGIWRHCMRASTPGGLTRLRELLKRIMWRHSMDHVQSECRLPPLHFTKVLLTFTRVEMENYRRLQEESQAELQRSVGVLQDRSALLKLDALRQACAHPQASSAAFGSEFKHLDKLGESLVQMAREKATASERDLCRAYNKLGLELWRQRKFDDAEQVFKQSWLVSDRGLDPEGAQQRTHHDQAASGIKTVRARSGVDAAAAAATKLLSSFESDVNIVTKNTQVREWRVIDLLITKHLASYYALQLRERHGITPEPKMTQGDEGIEETFQRIMQETRAMVPVLVGGQKVYEAAADKLAADAAAALPPQLAAGASAAAAASGAAMDVDDVKESDGPKALLPEDPTSAEVLLRHYHKQRRQYEYSLQDLLDLFHARLQDAAVLIELTYESELLPQWMENTTQAVKDLYALRQQVGVDTFSSSRERYLAQAAALWKELKARQEGVEDILQLYDLNQTKLRLQGLQEKLKDERRRELWDSIMAEMKKSRAFLAQQEICERRFVLRQLLSRRRKSKAAAATATPAKPLRSFDDRLARQLQRIQSAIAARVKRVGAATMERLRDEADLEYAEPMPGPRRFWSQYDHEWTVLRDSTHALKIIHEIAQQRQLMRRYVYKMLMHRASLLREAGLIDEAEEQRLKQARTEEMERIIEDDDDAEELDSPRKKKPKLEAHGAAAADEQDALDEGSAADVAAAAAEPEPSAAFRRFESDWDQARNIDALREAAVSRLRKDVAVATAKAHAEHATVQFIKRRVHITQEEAARILQQPCLMCHHPLSDPCFTKCGHTFDAHCLHRWLQVKPSCPTCRAELTAPTDYPKIALDELRAIAGIKAEEEETGGVTDAQAANGSLCLQAQAAAAEPKSSPVPVMVKAADSGLPGASASGALGLPRADWSDVRRLRAVGEGQIGSKIEACVKHIKYLQLADPSVQVLVFSQFGRVLEMLAQALAVNGVSCAQLKGTPEQRAQRIQEFQQPGAPTALLMSLRHDNHGLTLVNATAVFLLEPSLNASIEAQAVKRVHRIGQGREAHVYKLLMRDSVEEDIDQLAAREHAIEVGAAADSTKQAPVAAGADALLQQSSREAVNMKQLLQLMKVEESASHAAAAAAEAATPVRAPVRARSTGSRRSTGS